VNGCPNKWNLVTCEVIEWGGYVGKSWNKVSIEVSQDKSSLADLGVGHSAADLTLSVEGMIPLVE